MTEKLRAVLLLEYIGTTFSGSQMQHNGVTVQQVLEQALERLHLQSSRPVLAGRTDAGVHARGQVVHFDCDRQALERIEDLASAINAHMPESVAVRDTAVNPEGDFHAIRSAQWRWYQYRIYNHANRSARIKPDATWIRSPLDAEAMAEAAKLLLGTHDFASFKCPRTEIDNNVCTLIQSRVARHDDWIVFDVVANRFIYKMVRTMIGTLMEFGSRPERDPSEILQILADQNRQSAGPTAAAEGLTLMAIQYPKNWDFFPQDICVKTLSQVVQESSTHEILLRKAS